MLNGAVVTPVERARLATAKSKVVAEGALLVGAGGVGSAITASLAAASLAHLALYDDNKFARRPEEPPRFLLSGHVGDHGFNRSQWFRHRR